MILTVTANPALDLTYRVDHIHPGQTHRVSSVHARGGGKGVNVARVLASLGCQATALALAGGLTGESVRAQLAADGIDAELVEVAGETRRTVVVHDGSQVTGFWEPGPVVSGQEWSRFAARYWDLLAGADAVVLSGSLPPGTPADAYAGLIRAARQRGVPAVLDADGDALLHGLTAGPDVVKPNAEELSRAAGAGATALEGAAALCDLGARASVVSLGAGGIAAAAAGQFWAAAAPEVIEGNATGAGDATVAGIVMGLASGWPWPRTLQHAVALGCAAVHTAAAGEVDLTAYQRYLTAVDVQPVPAGRGR